MKPGRASTGWVIVGYQLPAAWQLIKNPMPSFAREKRNRSRVAASQCNITTRHEHKPPLWSRLP